jgi:hypothetical protein
MTDIQKAAKDAIDCQDACNASGVLFSFARHMQTLCNEANRLNLGTDWKNRNAIVILFLDKLTSLAGGHTEWRHPAGYCHGIEKCQAVIAADTDGNIRALGMV